MKRYKFLLIIVFVLSSLHENIGQAIDEEDSLKLNDLFAIALERNFDIKIAKGNKQIAENNVSLGNANYLPVLSLNGFYEYGIDNTDIQFAAPEQQPINATGAATQTTNGSINLSYTIFNGGSRNYIYTRLQELNYQEQLNLRAGMEQVVLSVLQQYLDYADRYHAHELDQKAVKISLSRFNKAEENYRYGIFTKLELLNAEVDLRNDSTALIQSELNKEKALKQLLNTMGISPDSSLIVSPKFPIEQNLTYAKLEEKAFNKNAQYLLSNSRVETAALQLKQTKSRWWPSLDLSASYRYNYQNNEAGFITSQETTGFNGRVSLSYNIFTGFNRNREQQNDKIRLEIQQERVEKTENNLRLNLVNTFNEYQTALKLLNLAERNIIAAQRNFARSEEAFATGQITGIELREAQLNLLNSLYSLRSQRIQAKIAEANLHFYAGSLVE